MSQTPWLTVLKSDAPLLVSLPHTGTTIPQPYDRGLVSPWLARKDADWWIDDLYDFAVDLGASVVRTEISRTVIDVNRDPSGASLYPGHATTGLCPLTTFDGEPLYRPGAEPDEDAIGERRARHFDPYHAALASEVERLRERHGTVVVYDCHSIRSVIPRLFEGILPHMNIGTADGRSTAPDLAATIAGIAASSGFGHVVDGRFKGGFITRNLGKPDAGVHAVQMELACRSYMDETPGAVGQGAWPPPYDPERAAPMRAVLRDILDACLDFALTR